MKKIVIIGGESTGKTTLCKDLAKAYTTCYVEEVARTYIDHLNRPYQYEDLLEIAKRQLQEEEEKKIEHANSILFIDTNLYVIQVWSEHKYKKVDAWILNQLATYQCDAYILTTPDITWQYDAQREHPDEKDRWYFFNVYKSILQYTAVPFIAVKGNEQERINEAKAFIHSII